MKTVSGLRWVRIGGGEALAAFLSPDGTISPLSGCVAKMAVMSDGAHAARVLVLAPPREFLDSDLSNYDWLGRWNRLRVYHGPEESMEHESASKQVERLLAEGLREHVKDANPSVAGSILEEAFGKKPRGWPEMQHTSDEDAEGTNLQVIDVRDLDEEERVQLQVIDVRDLDEEERVQLLTEVPKAWKRIIKDSGNHRELGGEDHHARQDTRSCLDVVGGASLGAVLGGTLIQRPKVPLVA
ncbi:hypothetical protein GNI_038530 [Gregarina niphandrodes]|uniref:Uncharacterized protein n=1 Tax=Gregarina niphandrodes TaxID=110365 RepID=A0A023BAM1_GRENI|nr:hypothetical protein GNI_038530 [Gregarina niphandrodes]EZG78294.1 hypothetical protein GNI_038530 [Gregarina niphandrodes]|eukprot:XP_011129363.1 hypothetical protein GNI_038530 [Gregarina niphandrodes]